MRILIVSDTHRKDDLYLDLVKQLQPIDHVIHCGDTEGSEALIRKAVICPVDIVKGNNDFFCDLPKEIETEIGNYKVWITHGNNYFVTVNSEWIKEEARSRNVDIVMYGHTHMPVVQKDGDLIVVNPGSLTYPRQEGRKCTYIIMEIGEDGIADFQICAE